MLLAWGSTAWGANCLNGVSEATCNTGNGDVCIAYMAGGELNFECDLTVNGDLTSASAATVLNPTSGAYESFGTDASGNAYCCISTSITNADPENVITMGGSFDDELAHQWTTVGGGTTYHLENASTVFVEGVLLGWGGDDLLTGGDGNTVLFDEVLDGRSGNDTLRGNEGNDWLIGWTGNDTCHGDAGQDTIEGGEGDDLLFGGDNNDKLYGELGSDELTGGAGDDELYGGWGDDPWIDGGIGDDWIDAGPGNDGEDDAGTGRVEGVYGRAGEDVVIGDDGVDWLYGGEEDDVVCGGDGDDFLRGNNGDDTLWAPEGIWSGEKDDIDGGGGTNSCTVAGSSSNCESSLDLTWDDPADKPAECP